MPVCVMHALCRYLEAALQLGVALPQDYHSELLLIYLQVCLVLFCVLQLQ